MGGVWLRSSPWISAAVVLAFEPAQPRHDHTPTFTFRLFARAIPCGLSSCKCISRHGFSTSVASPSDERVSAPPCSAAVLD